MRKISEIIVHCSATAEFRDFGAADIDRWHRAQGWDGIGYHYVVKLDGTVQEGRPLERMGAHCKGHNANSIGICYIGGLTADGKEPKDTRTAAQKAALISLIRRLKSNFTGAKVFGHRDFARKACPCFDAREEYEGI
ncbi:MAG: N-acetylmuramoyl-L-alanine amidase [Faecousia sp.]